jgi:glycerol-3-phosphate acyltransferase PlsY
MSLSTTVAMLFCPLVIWLCGGSYPEIILSAVSVLFMAFRHKENFIRLAKGTESKFQLYNKSGKKGKKK